MDVEERGAIHLELADLREGGDAGEMMGRLSATRNCSMRQSGEARCGGDCQLLSVTFLMYMTFASDEEMPRPPESLAKISEILICSRWMRDSQSKLT